MKLLGAPLIVAAALASVTARSAEPASSIYAKIGHRHHKTWPPIDRNIYGQFTEHIGRIIYDGLWVGDRSAIPNVHGYRRDIVAELIGAQPYISINMGSTTPLEAARWLEYMKSDKKSSLVEGRIRFLGSTQFQEYGGQFHRPSVGGRLECCCATCCAIVKI